jgi:hypothetical protein
VSSLHRRKYPLNPRGREVAPGETAIADQTAGGDAGRYESAAGVCQATKARPECAKLRKR